MFFGQPTKDGSPVVLVASQILQSCTVVLVEAASKNFSSGGWLLLQDTTMRLFMSFLLQH